MLRSLQIRMMAISQIPTISTATGIPTNTLKT